MKTVFMDFASSVQLHIWVQWLKSTIWEQTPEGQPLWWITHLSILGLKKKDFWHQNHIFRLFLWKKNFFNENCTQDFCFECSAADLGRMTQNAIQIQNPKGSPIWLINNWSILGLKKQEFQRQTFILIEWTTCHLRHLGLDNVMHLYSITQISTLHSWLQKVCFVFSCNE